MKKRGHKFEGELEGIYGGCSKRKGEGEKFKLNNNIKIKYSPSGLAAKELCWSQRAKKL